MRLRDRFDRSKRTPSTRRHRIGFALFWLLVLAFAYVIPTAPSFNTESHLFLTFSMVDHASFNIDHYHQRLGDESYWRGHYYSDKAPGLSFLAVPVYAVLKTAFPHHRPQPYTAVGKYQYSIPRTTVYVRYAITYVLLMLPAAIFGVLLWLFLSQFISAGWALVATAAYALGTTAYPYSTWYFSHQICAMLLFGAYLILYYRVRHAAPGRRALLFTALAGLLAGYAVISEYPTVLIAACVGGYALTVSRERAATAAAYIAGLLPAAAAAIAYNTLAFGKPFATGYNFVDSSMYRHHVATGLFGLSNPVSYGIQLPTWDSIWEITFGTYRGIFLLCPVLLLFLPGVAMMWRRRELRADVVLSAIVVVLYFLMDASRAQDVNGWSGGWSIASRHLVPVLPFMLLPAALLLAARWGRVVFTALAAVSIAMMFGVVATGLSLGFNFNDRNPIVHELWPAVSGGRAASNWGNLLGLQGVESLLPLAAIAVLLVARLLWLFHRLPEPIPVAPGKTVVAAEAR